MKIMHLRSSEFFGGPERAILGQCTNMTDHEFVCVSFIRRGEPNQFLKNAAVAGIETAMIDDYCAGDFRVISRLRKLVKRHNIDLLITHDYKGNFFGRLALKKTGTAHIAHFRGVTAEDKKVSLYNFIDRQVLKRMSTVLTVSEMSRKFLVGMGIPFEIIRVVPNAIDRSKFADSGYKREVPFNRTVRITAAGRLSFEKGYDNLLKAISLIVDKAPSFKVSIYGHGPEEENLKKMAEDLKINDFIEFCGFVDDILPVLKNSDFLVLPSRSEGMPNIILEAWAQKLGVLSASVGGVPEMITPGISGLLSQPENPESLSRQMLFAIDYPDEMIKYGEVGYELVQDKYSYKRQSELLNKIYSSVR